jgi:hypothetical protein
MYVFINKLPAYENREAIFLLEILKSRLLAYLYFT